MISERLTSPTHIDVTYSGTISPLFINPIDASIRRIPPSSLLQPFVPYTYQRKHKRRYHHEATDSRARLLLGRRAAAPAAVPGCRRLARVDRRQARHGRLVLSARRTHTSARSWPHSLRVSLCRGFTIEHVFTYVLACVLQEWPSTKGSITCSYSRRSSSRASSVDFEAVEFFPRINFISCVFFDV